jgi:hypothetical protein
MFGADVGTMIPRITPTSVNSGPACKVEVAWYQSAHPQQMNVHKRLANVSSGCVNHSMWFLSLNQGAQDPAETQQFAQLRKIKINMRMVEVAWRWIHLLKHMNVLKQLVHAWKGCGNHSMWVCGLNKCTMTSFVTQLQPKNFAKFFKFRAIMCGGSGMAVDPWAHPQHMNGLKHIVYVNPCGFGASTKAHKFQLWHKNCHDEQVHGRALRWIHLLIHSI